MKLSDKMNAHPTVKGKERCTGCGNNWFFATGEHFECTTCGLQQKYEWRQLFASVGKWTINGWVHQHQDEEKVKRQALAQLKAFDVANNWKHEKELDKKGENGTTVTPDDMRITDEYIEKVASGRI